MTNKIEHLPHCAKVFFASLFALSCMVATNLLADSCVSPPANLGSWWRAEGNANDSGASNNGAIFGGVSFVAGKVGQAFSFDGTSGYVNFGTSVGNFGTSDFTIEFWIKTTAGNGAVSVIEKWPTCGHSSKFNIRMGSGHMNAEVETDAAGNNFFSMVGSRIVNDGVYHHVALVRTQTSLSFYVDGTLDVTGTTPGVASISNAVNLVAGKSVCVGADGTVRLAGQLDEISVYLRALSLSELQAIYNAGTAGKCTAPVPATITSHPANQTVAAGSNVTFTVAANGTAPLTYQWLFNATNIIGGATNASLSLANVQPGQAGNYSVLVANAYGSVISSNAVLNVSTFSPAITSQPGNQTVAAGGNATFTIVVTGTPPLSYQWRFNETNLLAGATNASLSFTNVQPSHAGNYSVLVTNSYGSTGSSNALLTVLTFSPVINPQPGNQTVAAGGNATFTIAATGTPPLSYQWLFNGTNQMVGATNASLTLVNVQPGMAGNYSVLVANAYGSAGSSNALLTVLTFPPGIASQPSNQTVILGSTATFTTGVGGTAPLNYQWLFNATNVLAGATNASLVLTNIQPVQAGNYSLFVTNLYGSALSSNATLIVNPPVPCTPASSNLVAWWNGEGNANDSAATNNGTLFGGMGFVAGKVGQAFNFDGVDDEVRFGTSIGNFGTSDFTIEFWLRTTAGNSSVSVLEKWPGCGHSSKFNIRLGSGRLSGEVETDIAGNNFFPLSGTRIVNDGVYHHVALVRTPTSLSFYVDGTMDVTGATPGVANINNAVEFVAGRSVCVGADGTVRFTGQLDEISVYLRALSLSEVQAIYNAGTLGKCTAPSGPYITSQPTNQTVSVGQTVAFVVEAFGSSPLSYQWTVNGTNITGGTNVSLALTNVQLNQAGNYSVFVSNYVSSTMSSNALLTVNPPVAAAITSQPQSKTVLQNSDTSFTVGVSGTSPFTYQWQFNGSNLAGATVATLALTNVQPSQAGSYSVVVGNAGGSTNSAAATLTVQPTAVVFFDDFDPGIDTSMWATLGATNIGNSSVVMTIATNIGGSVSGLNSLWLGGTGSRLVVTRPIDTTSGGIVRFNLRISNGGAEPWEMADLPGEGIVLEYTVNGGTSWIEIGRYDTSAYIVWTNISVNIPAGAQSPQTHFRWRQLSNSGSCCDHWALDDTTVLATPVAPAIITQPQSQTNYVGLNATFTVAVTGSQPLIYQWSFNGTNIVGAINPSLTLTNVQLNQAGSYSVGISNSIGMVVSSNALLTVRTLPPTIATQPSNQTVLVGGYATFTVAVSGTAPLSYQWLFNSTNVLPAATNASLVLTNVQPGAAGTYSVLVTNAYGSVTSSNAALTVVYPPAVVRVVNASGMAGSTVAVPVQLLANGNENALGFSLSYNTNLLAFTNVVLGGGAGGAALIPNVSQTASGKVGVALALNSGSVFAPGAQEMVLVNFTIVAAPSASNQTTSVTFGDAPTTRQLVDAAAGNLAAYYTNGIVTIPASDWEGDTAPRTNGDKQLKIADWVQVGRFVAKLDVPNDGSEYQRADCAPRATLGNGILSITDWVQAGRYAAGLDPLTVVDGPTTEDTNAVPLVGGGKFQPKSVGRTLRVTSRTVQAAVTNTVTVQLEALGNENAVGFSLNFNPALLQFVSASLGADAGNALSNLNTSAIGSGKLGVALALSTGVSWPAGTRELLKVNFAVAASATGTSNVAFASSPIAAEISDAAANTLTATYASGVLTFSPYPPVLRANLAETNAVVAWPVVASNFVLQVNADPAIASSNWSNASENPAVIGEDKVVTITNTAGTKFFRLYKP